ncbi:hypothetical protein GALMADRAFT_282594 [Galerina marginata CBS 339.88]|uniref:pyranose dehydrogenase (acceptor) n=1 Tax=Galerina marginata (strain CBS 339.88) TaxID=685588 RepID=A0A067SFH4_GALM3|nr:hypothetical protein GALMADRAFT_282594 [Galerina marginata CBS 339.88]
MSSYDIIFAGGGATACITASRLAEAHPNLKILILEAGPDSDELHYHIQPGRSFKNLLVRREVYSFHIGKGGKGTGERMHLVPAGRTLGGGSAINFVIYMRPAPSDYDDWETVHGNKGWNSSELIALLKKAETFQPNPNHPSHGSSGPIKVSYASSGTDIGTEFIKVGAAADTERSITTEDLNDFTEKSLNTWGPMARYVDENTGRRSDAAHNYIYTKKQKNITVITRAKVRRVLFEGTKAVGVEYVDDAIGRTKAATEPIVIKASRLVVLSAGAFGSPAILERSGIAATELLTKLDIKEIADLPGVGQNYMDHNMVAPAYLCSEDAVTLDVVLRGTEEEFKSYSEEWLKDGKGLFANNGIDGGIRLRPTEADLKTMSPTFDERWTSYYANKPDKPVIVLSSLAAYAGRNPAVPRGRYFSLSYFSTHPLSTGHVHITSAVDLYSPLNFAPGFLTEDADLVILRWAYKKSREIARRMKYFRGELVASHPVFPAGSAATTGREEKPVDIDAADIVYTEADDKAIDDYHRNTVETTWHSAGTCSMKARENGGVIDSKLNVFGTSNLKVADCSIIPANVSANTYSTAMAIGEKAAVIIGQELGN